MNKLQRASLGTEIWSALSLIWAGGYILVARMLGYPYNITSGLVSDLMPYIGVSIGITHLLAIKGPHTMRTIIYRKIIISLSILLWSYWAYQLFIAEIYITGGALLINITLLFVANTRRLYFME